MGDHSKTTIFATIDRDRKRKLFHKLMDENIFYKDWLEKQIDEYTKPKPRRKAA